ncbi:MAG: family 20 glycosylhydrolase [Phycisphaerae bacterium]
MAELFTSPKPAVGIRGLHLDLKGVPPTFERLLGLLKVIAAARYNALLVEWEDMFPWTVDTRFRCETAYSPRQVEQFHQAAAALGLEIIPLVQCLGHMETPLSVSGNERLRELPWKSDCLNPLAPGARELVEGMIVDVLALTPGVRYFHLGGDEAWSLGMHPDTKAFIAKHGKAALYLRHVEPILDKLNKRSIRPILWSDMMHDWPGEQLAAIGRKADLCPWGYRGHPDEWKHHSASKNIARFKEHGVQLWGAGCYKGAEGHNADLPDLAARLTNALAWAEVARRYGMKGVFATAWSRYSTHRTQNEPIDACLDAMMLVGKALHDGKAAMSDVEACLAALDAIGERQRLEACKLALTELADARYWGWGEVQRLREQITLEVMDARRRGSAAACGFLKDLKRHLGVGAAGAISKARAAFAGLMEPIWVERYLAERIEPLLEELGGLESRVRIIEPDAYAAMFGPK